MTLITEITDFVLTSGGGGGDVSPAFGKTGQVAVVLGLVIALFFFSYLFSRVGYDFAED